MAKPSGLPPRPKGERSIVKARFDGTRQRTRRSCAPLLEGTRQRTRRSCAHLQKIDTEKDAAGGSLQTLTTGSDSPLGNTWEQDQEQDACLPAYRPLENRTERQTVSSARREQGPRALLTKRSKALPNPRSVPGTGSNCSKPQTSAGKTTNRRGRVTTLTANVPTLFVNCPRTSVCAHIN